jgi:hypothetical protein
MFKRQPWSTMAQIRANNGPIDGGQLTDAFGIIEDVR